jgi:hypothetical protein
MSAGRRDVKTSGDNRKMVTKEDFCAFVSSMEQIIVMEFEITDSSLECLYHYPIAL